MQIDACHLPGLEMDDVVRWDELLFDDARISLRFPVLRPGAIRRLAARLRSARAAHLAPRSTPSILEALDRAAARLADDSDPLGRIAGEVLPAITGYSDAMIRHVLARATEDWRRPALRELLVAELGDSDALDRFVARAPTRVRSRAFGPEFAVHVFAGNIPGVAVTSLIRSLLVKSATLGKTASGEPLLAVLFARALADVDVALASCLAVTYWRGGDELETEAFAEANTVIAYGGRAAIASVRARLPAHVGLVEHGARISFGLIGRHGLHSVESVARVAADAARATATFDQQGCVSPHFIYVERGNAVSPADFARLLAAELGKLAVELPRGRPDPAEAAAIHDARATAEFRGIAGEDVHVLASAETSYTVIVEPRPDFEASCMFRVIRVKPIGDLEEVLDHISAYRDVLQTVALEGLGDRLESFSAQLGAAGVSRITSFAAMPWPPATWHHDGRGPLRELLRWVDLEHG